MTAVFVFMTYIGAEMIGFWEMKSSIKLTS
nr:MAG TPA: hypothetical protein [Caudoviricetes sp.]